MQPASAPHAVTPVETKMAHAVDVMIQDDKWRTNVLQGYLNTQMNVRSNPYFTYAGVPG